jgi:pyruvate/2-oxoglutarate/acetoin dehydrogenase E1 component
MERKDHRVEVEVMDLNSNNSLDLAEVVASVISTSVTLKIYLDRLLVARILSPTSLTTTMNFSVVDLEVWV